MKNRKRAAIQPMPAILMIFVIALFFTVDRILPDDRADRQDESGYEDQYTEQGSGEQSGSLFHIVDPNTLNGPFSVDYVVDGDTLYIINAEGDPEKIRMIGVDTPESVHQDESRNVEEGKVASKYTNDTLTAAGSVYLAYDIEHYDDYGRTLAYVYIATDGGYTMMQDLLLYEGMARTMTIQPNSSFADHFAAVQRDAQANERGFWGDYSSLFVENEG